MTEQQPSKLKRFLLSLSEELVEAIDELRGDQERCAFIESLLLQNAAIKRKLLDRLGGLPMRSYRGGYTRRKRED